MKINSRDIAVAAVTVALTFIFGYFPFVFLIPLLFTCVTRGMRMSLFMGLVFGIVSAVYSLMGGSLVAIAFVKAPWIAIVPRIFIGFFGHGAYFLAKKIIKSNTRAAKFAKYSISAAIGTLANTAMVVTLLVVFMGNTELGNMTIYLYVPTMLISGVFEMLVGAILVPPIALTYEKAKNRYLPAKMPVCEQCAQIEKNDITAEPQHTTGEDK